MAGNACKSEIDLRTNSFDTLPRLKEWVLRSTFDKKYVLRIADIVEKITYKISGKKIHIDILLRVPYISNIYAIARNFDLHEKWEIANISKSIYG